MDELSQYRERRLFYFTQELHRASECAMKQQVTGTETCLRGAQLPGAAAALSLQEELVAAIHGAFEVAVEIAVREVTSLLATSGNYAELRRENESLKERLQRAEAALDCRRAEAGRFTPTPEDPLSIPTKHAHHPVSPLCLPPGGWESSCSGERDEGSPPPDPRDEPLSLDELDSGSEANQHIQCLSQDITDQNVVKVESLKASCNKAGTRDSRFPPHPGKSTLEQVVVKQERLDDLREGSPSCLDAIKMEDYSLDCMSEVQSRMLEEQKLLMADDENQDLNLQLSTAGLDQADSPNPTTSIPPVTDLLSLSSEFPNLFQVADPAAPSEAPPQVYGVRVRTGRSLSSTLYACKSCGQAFHLPSLLRRHNGQCQQRLQQRCPLPPAPEGSTRTRLQLFPPGCSPFHCTVCNREFNRLENLKTHLRIHTGERPYTCSVCSKCFRHSGALKRHIRIHTGEKPYVCVQCGKSFRNWGGLKFHQRSHAKQLQS